MAIFRRGGVYWFEFVFNATRVRESTKTGNAKAARQIEAARRVALAKGEVGIQERLPVPTLKEFAPRFEGAIETKCGDRPETVRFHKEKLRRLLADRQLAGARLDAIDEAAIDGYKQRRTWQASRYRTPVSPASVNRELATLRRLLRLAQKWKVIDRAPSIEFLGGERNREFVLSHGMEPKYLETAPQPLRDVAVLILETGVRPGEAVNLRWPDVHLQPAVRAKFGYIAIRGGKSKNAKRNLCLTARAAEILTARKAVAKSTWVFPGDSPDAAMLGTSIDHQHDRVRDTLKLSKEFVVHSLRHTMLTRLGEGGADAFTIMKIAGHSNVIVSQRYVHPTPEGMERAFERLEALNAAKFEEAKAEAMAAAAAADSHKIHVVPVVPTKVPTAKKRSVRKISQVVEFKYTGP